MFVGLVWAQIGLKPSIVCRPPNDACPCCRHRDQRLPSVLLRVEGDEERGGEMGEGFVGENEDGRFPPLAVAAAIAAKVDSS
ncbi:hypothetical protein RHMOL_Rhmol13G0286800 [Rhododendron molle]|uniref:Uncharacterized protein n=1 Tax=Rhododendron molle TaxID=49168 RepID=A0ACC0LCT8_RHOML|nr:hypothetical protein RHMOL_Rhmol13G0286800 [Rhododendron molle]